MGLLSQRGDSPSTVQVRKPRQVETVVVTSVRLTLHLHLAMIRLRMLGSGSITFAPAMKVLHHTSANTTKRWRLRERSKPRAIQHVSTRTGATLGQRRSFRVHRFVTYKYLLNCDECGQGGCIREG